jgi:hypothetical protein
MFVQANETTWVRKIEGKLQSRKNFKMPGTAEMRFQVWASILSGAKGVLFFPYTSQPQPPAEDRQRLDEWEYGTGMRSLDGQPSASHAGFAVFGPRLKDRVALLGRLEPQGESSEAEMVIGRRFRDSKTDRAYVILMNRDLSRARKAPQALLTQLRVSYASTLEPGDGVCVEPD